MFDFCERMRAIPYSSMYSINDHEDDLMNDSFVVIPVIENGAVMVI